MEKSNSSIVLCWLIIVDFISHLCALSCQSEICQKYVSSMDQLVDNNVSPCDNFYGYSCSHYNQANRFKGDPMKMTESRLNSRLSDLLKDNKNVSESKAIQSVKHFYFTCINTDARGRNGNGILLEKLTDYGGWPILQNSMDSVQFDDPHFEMLIGRLRRLGYSLLIKLNVKVDELNSNRYITELNVPHVEPLPDFNGNIMTYIGVIAAQSTVIRNMAKLLGSPTLNDSIIKQDIKDMLTFQMKLQQIANRSRDVHNSYNVMKITNLDSLFSPKFNWIEYLNAVFDGIKKFGPQDELLIPDVDYLVKLMDLIDSAKPRTVRNYLLWQVVKDVAEDGDSTMRTTITPFRGNANMIGDTCLKEAKGFMGFAVLAMHLDGNDHRLHLTLVNIIVSYLKKAFSSLIENNSWMDSVTKEKAQIKLKSMGVKFGYQQWILNKALLDTFYSKMPQLRDNHLENIFILSHFHSLLELDLVNKAVNKLNWHISPLISNAFYHRSLNEIYIPIAILQEPLFHLEWPMSANFGAIGSVIGHEMVHGFDSKSLVTASNNSLVNWWPSSVTKKYEAAANCVKGQYERYCLSPQTTGRSDLICVNGENTLIENIADIGGVKASFEGFLLWKSDNTEASSIFKSEKLFFLAYSQLWCSQLNPSIALDQIVSSINSPHKYRLIGPLENLDNFKNVFNCTTKLANSQCLMW